MPLTDARAVIFINTVGLTSLNGTVTSLLQKASIIDESNQSNRTPRNKLLAQEKFTLLQYGNSKVTSGKQKTYFCTYEWP